jgi:hypothetical protein
MNLCKTCEHWKVYDGNLWDGITDPTDVDGNPMEMTFLVRDCQHPALVMFERTCEKNGFGLTDASQFFARLSTAENFGCVRHESKAN